MVAQVALPRAADVLPAKDEALRELGDRWQRTQAQEAGKEFPMIGEGARHIRW